jgi:hypothetical protein
MNFVNKLYQGGASLIEKNRGMWLHNPYVLYFVVIVTFFNIIGHTLNGNLGVPILFVLVAAITSFFSKNMIIILIVGVGVANLFAYNKKRDQDVTIESNNKEGMENEDEEGNSSSGGGVDRPDDTSDRLKVDQPNGTADGKNKRPSGSYKDRKSDFDFIRGKYSELVKIQEQLMNNVGGMEGSMANMDKLVDGVKGKLDTIKQSISSRG